MRALAVCGLSGLLRAAGAGGGAPPKPGATGTGVGYRGFLGRGYDIMESDLWTFEDVRPTEFYRLDIPDACFQKWPCPRTEAAEANFFDSIADFSRSFYSSFGIRLEGRLMGIEGSLSASMQKSLAQYGESTRSILDVRISKRASCYHMRGECAFDPGSLNPIVLDVIETLPVDSADAKAMALWDRRFIQRFGTHVSLDSVHGARVKIIATSNSSQEGMEHFLRSAVHAYISSDWGEHIGGKLAISPENEQLDNRSLAQTSYSVRCSAIGGSTAQSPCIKVEQLKTDTEAHGVGDRLEEFFLSESLSDGRSVLSMLLEEMAYVLDRMGYTNHSRTLTKASEYRRCRWPFHWAKIGEEEHGCKCQLTCQNSGEVDEDSCTCKFPSDEFRGRTGANRSQPFGTCQMGPASCGQGARHRTLDSTCALPI